MSAVRLSLNFNKCLTQRSGEGVWLHAVVRDWEAFHGACAAQTEMMERERKATKQNIEAMALSCFPFKWKGKANGALYNLCKCSLIYDKWKLVQRRLHAFVVWDSFSRPPFKNYLFLVIEMPSKTVYSFFLL